MSEENVIVTTKQDRICTLTINRPERRNALNKEVILKLSEALRSAGEDGQTRVAVLRGAGEQAFSAGYEIGQLPNSRDLEAGSPFDEVIDSVEKAPFPVIAMIYGYCVAGGSAWRSLVTSGSLPTTRVWASLRPGWEWFIQRLA